MLAARTRPCKTHKETGRHVVVGHLPKLPVSEWGTMATNRCDNWLHSTSKESQMMYHQEGFDFARGF